MHDDFYRTLLDNLYDGVYFADRERTITYWNRGAERITGYAAADVVGKKCADNILVHIDGACRSLCKGQCPLAATLKDGEMRTSDVFLLHRSGHRVPVSVRVAPIRDAGGVITGAVEIFTDAAALSGDRGRAAELERMAYFDPLTGVANRRYAEIALSSRLEEFKRYEWPFGLLFFDIDNFKAVNDRFGHSAGDAVLRMVAQTLANGARPFDVVGRWGGEEFVGIIANVSRDELLAAGERFRMLTAQSRLHDSETIAVTVSVGAAHAKPDDTGESLVERADRLMYESKKAGKNRTTGDQ